MPKKKQTFKITLTRKVLAKKEDGDLCGLGPGVLYQDDITYETDKPSNEVSPMLAAQVVRDTQDLLEELFAVEVEVKTEAE
jgi:hypothetical protein